MSHETGTIIITLAMPHNPASGAQEEREHPTPIEPCVRISLDEGCSETDCVEAARRAYRRLKRRA